MSSTTSNHVRHSARNGDHGGTFVEGGCYEDFDEQFEAAPQVDAALTFDGDNSTTDGVHVYSLSSSHHPSRPPAVVQPSAPRNYKLGSYHEADVVSPRPLFALHCLAKCGGCGIVSSRIEKWSGVVTNLYFKRLGLIGIAICSVTIGLRTTTMVQESLAATTVANQLIFGFTVLFTVQVSLEILHCSMQLINMCQSEPHRNDRGPSTIASHHLPSVESPRRTVPAGSTSRYREIDRRHLSSTKLNRWIHIRVGFSVLDASVVALSWKYDTILVVRTFLLLKGLRRSPGISELRLLIHALGLAAPTLSALAAMLLVVLYVFSVLFCSFFGDMPYFDGLATTSWTLFQLLTLDNWSEIAIRTNDEYPRSWILMVSYIFVAVFVGMSLLVAVMTLAVSNAFQERLRQSLSPDPLMMTSAPDDRAPAHASRTTATRRCGSERTGATLTEPFLEGDSFFCQSLAAERDCADANHGGGDDFGDFGQSLSSRLMRLEQKIDMIAQIQSSVHKILLQREKVS